MDNPMEAITRKKPKVIRLYVICSYRLGGNKLEIIIFPWPRLP
jgi:hypothetical protein